MKRLDICASDDHDTIARLVAAVHALGVEWEGEDESLGVGLHPFQFPEGELSVFVDAWVVDVAGPDELVDRLLAILADSD